VISSKLKILIVDDDTTILHCLSKIFQRKGYCVTTAERGREAIEKIGALKYDVALVDLMLPDMEGDKLFPLINQVSPETVKIMLTGNIELEDSIEGVDAFILKPVPPEKLLNIIESKLSLKPKRKKQN
jgi:two-component system response regulator GlrR